jgi:hypothetical protein
LSGIPTHGKGGFHAAVSFEGPAEEITKRLGGTMLKSGNYLTILPFMIQDFGLRGAALITYAVIHSFSQDGASCFSGSVGYIAEWAGADERTIRNSLELLLENELIIVQKRPGYTSRYAVNPAKLPDTPEKTSGDIDLSIDPEKETKKDQGDFVFEDTPARSKEDATVVFNLARSYSNERHILPECRDLVIPPAYYDILATIQNYTWQEIRNALDNFDWHKSGRCGPGWKPPPPFRSLYGFLKTGVAQYCDDDTAKALFAEGQKYGVER